MLIYNTCGACGERGIMFGFNSANGFVCSGCATHAHCADCGKLHHKNLLSDLGDGFLTCEDCQLEVVTRAQMARQDAARR